MIFGREPAVWIGLIRDALILAAVFGLVLNDLQLGAIILFLGRLGDIFVRSQSTPAKPATVDDLKTYIAQAPPDVINKAGVKIVTSDKTI